MASSDGAFHVSRKHMPVMAPAQAPLQSPARQLCVRVTSNTDREQFADALRSGGFVSHQS